MTVNCRERMNLLRMLDFAIVETALFLDAYPDNAEALAYYHELKMRYKAAYKEYETTCGPLTIYSNESKTTWELASAPLPWELSSD